MLCTVVLFKKKEQMYAWVTIVPSTWLVICTMSAGWYKAFSSDPAIGFFAKANQLSSLLASGNFKPNAVFKSQEAVERVIFNNQIDGFLIVFFMIVVVVMIFFTVQACLKALKSDKDTAAEVPYAPLPANAEDILRGAVH